MPAKLVGALAAAVVALVVVTGVWVAGGVLTDDAATAKALTGAWFVVAGALAAWVAIVRRPVAVPVLGAWLVTTLAVGGFLGVTSSVDRIVHEDVVVATRPPDVATRPPDQAAVAGPVLQARGTFRSGAHRTAGVASLLRTASGHRVLTLTGFTTSPGPDLRVYLVPRGGGVDDAVDLGGLKGNKGDQQYDVPPRARQAGRVVVWCRAFSVAFGSAALRPPA